MRPCKSLFLKKKTLKAASSKNNLSEILVQKGFHIKKKRCRLAWPIVSYQ